MDFSLEQDHFYTAGDNDGTPVRQSFPGRCAVEMHAFEKLARPVPLDYVCCLQDWFQFFAVEGSWKTILVQKKSFCKAELGRAPAVM